MQARPRTQPQTKAQAQAEAQGHPTAQRTQHEAHQRQKARRAETKRNQDGADEETAQQRQETRLSSGPPCGQTSTQS